MKLRCAMCAVGKCYHPVKGGAEDACRERDAEVLLSGTSLCLGCASGRISIEEQLAFYAGMNRGQDATSQPHHEPEANVTEAEGRDGPYFTDDNRLPSKSNQFNDFFGSLRSAKPPVEPGFVAKRPAGSERDAVLEPGGRKDDTGHDDDGSGER